MTPSERGILEAMATDWHAEADAIRRAENRDTDRVVALHFCADALTMALRLMPDSAPPQPTRYYEPLPPPPAERVETWGPPLQDETSTRHEDVPKKRKRR